MKKLERTGEYLPPKMEMLDVSVEQGFALSLPSDQLPGLEYGEDS